MAAKASFGEPCINAWPKEQNSRFENSPTSESEVREGFFLMKKVTIHTDGGCHGNPGPGGWAAVLEYGEHRRELSGGAPATTNNRMEIQSALEALKSLKQP